MGCLSLTGSIAGVASIYWKHINGINSWDVIQLNRWTLLQS